MLPLPLRLVIDTNVVISAALKPEGLQRTVLLLALTKPARLYLSDAILSEYREVLARPELQIRKGVRQQLLQLIKNGSHLITPTQRLQVATDPDDNMFLECSDAARAELSNHLQPAAFSKILETNQNHHHSRIHHRRRSASDPIRDQLTATNVD